jgi:hypothetical protein
MLELPGFVTPSARVTGNAPRRSTFSVVAPPEPFMSGSQFRSIPTVYVVSVGVMAHAYDVPGALVPCELHSSALPACKPARV